MSELKSLCSCLHDAFLNSWVSLQDDRQLWAIEEGHAESIRYERSGMAYSVRSRSNLIWGTQITNRATIVFDTEGQPPQNYSTADVIALTAPNVISGIDATLQLSGTQPPLNYRAYLLLIRR